MKSIVKLRDISIHLGNTLDHFDTSIYAFLAPFFGKLYFPSHDPITQIILAYSVFATALFTRPIGALLFGLLARKKGPMISLSYSILGMSLPTLLLAFLPSAEQISGLAPMGLILLRMCRGIFASGENTIARLYILDGKDLHQTKKSSYIFPTFSMIGMAFASLVSTFIIELPIENIAWRICFFITAIVELLGFFLRQRVCRNEIKAILSPSQKSPQQNITEENASKSHSVEQKSLVLWKLFWREKTNICRVAVATYFSHITYAIPFVLLNVLVPMVTDITPKAMLALNTALFILDMILVPLVGKFILRYNSKQVMLIACGILLVTIIPLFMKLPEASMRYVTFLRIWIVFFGVVFLCPLNAWIKTLFEGAQHDQYLLVGMGSALGSVTGRMIPAICLWLWHISGSLLGPAIFTAVSTGIMMLMLGNWQKGWLLHVGEKIIHPKWEWR